MADHSLKDVKIVVRASCIVKANITLNRAQLEQVLLNVMKEQHMGGEHNATTQVNFSWHISDDGLEGVDIEIESEKQ